MRLLPAIPLLLAAAFAPGSARAAESYDSCTGTISVLPAVISTGGTWCMKADLATGLASGAAITINANNVTIDCNGRKLGGLAAGAGTTTMGIQSVDRTNVVIRRCQIRGFFFAVALFDGSGHLIEDNRLDGNTWGGIDVETAATSIVRRNAIFDTGGTTVRPDEAFGINATGEVDILDNTISGLSATGEGAAALGVNANTTGAISNNRIRNLSAVGLGSWSYGIRNRAGNAVIKGNEVQGLADDMDYGIYCGPEAEAATTVAVDNTITGFYYAFSYCTDVRTVIH